MSELCWLLIGPQAADEQQLRPETFIHHSAASLCPAADRQKGDQQNYKLSRRGIIMDLDSIEGMNEIRPSVYRAAMKLLSLQKLCHMDVVFVRHITAALRSVDGVKQQQDIVMNREEVTRTLNRMFHSVSQDVPGHVTVAAPEETCSLMMRLFDRSHSGCVSARSLQTALIALSADNLLLKFRGLVSVSGNSSGSVSRSGLRSLLQDLTQVPAAVQEEVVFGGVEVAVLTPTASEEHVMSWLQSEPRLLLWLPTLYRLSVGQNISHNVRCHTCKTLPITGLRYRCMKCVNVHVCQSCFLTDRQSRKHKIHHPVLEFCTQPTWRESLSSLMRRARHSLLPRRYTQTEADRQRVLMWAEPAETQDRAPPPSDASSGLADPADSPSSDGDVSHDASGRRPSPPQCSTKALQTDEETPSQQASLLTEVRNLQRDRWLLEQQLQAWRLTVQSEQGVLEDRCSEMEVTMETLRQHNTCLQGMLTQALDKMEAQTHANNTPEHVENTEGNITPSSNTEEEEEELMKAEEEWTEDELQTPSPTIHQGSPLSHDQHCEEESADDVRLHHPIGPQDRPEEAELHRQDTCPSGGGGGDCGKCIPEELLQERVDRLKTQMETDGWTERQTGETGEIKGAELLQAADQVGQSVQQLVDAVRTK
ncbi:dystrotelin isoform X3 [Amphiprion ocellaris]|uniref:dystrotelin isoform X3 n=1 Tax=Amphiprion ocellaris TaxID=80972 RepID=UPI0024111159|nr:dystrotelin isoform X3 [Amphiprion ocellaris]